jgi:ABC-type multidrug transport system ATPase subunit
MTSPSRDTGPPTLLEAHRLSFAYPQRPLFADLSFVVRPGLTLVRGGDGAGKSTLLRLMADVLAPDAGTLHRLAGAPFLADPTHAADDPLTVRAWLAAHRAARAGWDEAIERTLIDGFSLGEHVDKGLFMLSTGSRRKAGLVAAFASGAPLVLLDTPFAGLDGPSRALLGELLAEGAASADRGWVVADYELPAPLTAERLSGVIELGE